MSGKAEEVNSKLRLDDANRLAPHLCLLFLGTAGVEVNQKKNGLGGILGRRKPDQYAEGRKNTGSEGKLI